MEFTPAVKHIHIHMHKYSIEHNRIAERNQNRNVATLQWEK